MTTPHRPRKRPLADINVVPYIDVMLVLLIIFMVTAPLLRQGVKVTLPKARTQALKTKHQSPIIITIDKAGNYYLNIAAQPKNPLTMQALVNQLLNTRKQSAHQQSVLIKGDRYVPYGKVVHAMALLQEAGINQLGLMTENKAD